MVFSIAAKNTAQAIAETSTIANSTTTPLTIVVPPIGKRSIVTGQLWCVNTGAGAEGRLVANGIIIARWPTAGTALNDNNPDRTGAGGMFPSTKLNVNLVLESLQTLVLDQDSGTNAQFKRILKVLELPS